jgi:LytS/YehU family sensor histidine kinase
VFAEEISDDVLAARVPRFLLQPLVENAVRHGIARLSSGGTLLLKVNRRADTLVVEIVNDCPALPVVVDGREGLGLVNTQARLEHLYGEDQSITVVPDFTIGKFDVTVRVPFTTQEMTAIPSEDSAA